MKKRLCAAFLTVLFALQALSETCVWKAENEGSTICLGGTFHLLRPSDFPLPTEFNTAFEASDLLVCEADAGELTSAETQQKLMAAATYSDGSTLSDHLSPETFKLLAGHCAEKNIPIAMLQHVKPAMAVLTITRMELMELGATPQGVDTVLYERAVKNNKPVKPLESIDDQIHFLVHMGFDDPDAFVGHSLNDLKATTRDFPFMLNAWKIGDTSGLEHFVIDSFREIPRLYKQTIVDRNNAWLKNINTWQQTPQIEFILVGAAHLIGPDGILNALQADGWQIEQLRAPGR